MTERRPFVGEDDDRARAILDLVAASWNKLGISTLVRTAPATQIVPSACTPTERASVGSSPSTSQCNVPSG